MVRTPGAAQGQGQAQDGQHAGDGVEHRLAGDVVAAVVVAAEVEDAGVLADVFLEGRPGVTGEEGVEDADGPAALQEQLRILDVGPGQRGVDEGEENPEDQYLRPEAAEIAARAKGAVHQKDGDDGDEGTRALVGVLAQPQGQAAEYPPPPLAGGLGTPKQEKDGADPEEREGIGVSPAAHVDRPAHRGPEEGAEEGDGAVEELAGQEVQHRRGESAGDQMGKFDGEVARAEELVEEGDVVVIKPGHLQTGNLPGFGAQAVEDVQGLFGDVGLVQPQAARGFGDAVEAGGRRHSGDDQDSQEIGREGPARGQTWNALAPP